jgi:hypothetical protein
VLHGLPANDQAYKGITGYADSLASTGRPTIVVGAQGARPGDTDPEWHNWGPGRDWETATESELVTWIDDHYRTIPERSARGIIGISAGGYGAALIAIHHPETYSVIESWSGYFVLTTPEGKPKDLGSAEANADASAHAHVDQLEDEFRPYGKTFIGFYIGAGSVYGLPRRQSGPRQGAHRRGHPPRVRDLPGRPRRHVLARAPGRVARRGGGAARSRVEPIASGHGASALLVAVIVSV